MKRPIVILVVALLAFVTESLATAATPLAKDVRVTFKLSFGEEVDLCFAPVPRDEIETPVLPVALRVTHVYKRSTAKRVYRSVTTTRFNLSDIGTKERESFTVGNVGVLPCATFQPKNPFLISFRDLVQTGRFTLEPYVAKKRLGRATYTYTMRITGSRQIFEGTDAFWNYCISEVRSVRSSGGKLYCWTEGDFSVSMRRV